MSALDMMQAQPGACLCPSCDMGRQSILDAYAHELAERLRACKGTAELVGLDTAGLLAAADLIDPEIE